MVGLENHDGCGDRQVTMALSAFLASIASCVDVETADDAQLSLSVCTFCIGPAKRVTK